MSQAKSSSGRSSRPLELDTIDNNSSARAKSGVRHHLMQEQFYSNNDRWRRLSIGGMVSEMDKDGRRQQQAMKISSQQKQQQRPSDSHHPTARLTSTTPTDDVSSPQPNIIRSYHSPNRLTNITNTSLIAHNSTTSDNYSSIAHFKMAATLSSLLAMALVGCNASKINDCTTKQPAGVGGDVDHNELNTLPEECHTPGSTMNNIYDCEPDSSNLLRSMKIVPEESNFSDYTEVWLVKSWQEILLRVSFVAPIVLAGLLGNLMIIYSMCKFKTIRSKPTNLFILNMALADLLTSIFCPNAALFSDIFQFYVLGSFVCRFEGSIKITCLLVSAYSLIVLSFDWFLCVVKPCRKRITIKQTLLTLVVIWIVSIAMSLPLVYFRSLRHRQWKDLDEVWCCESIKETKQYWMVITLFLIYLPTFVMTVVLVVILAQMDKFEAKLKKTRQMGNYQNGFSTNNSLRLQATSSMTSAAAATASSTMSNPASVRNSNRSSSFSVDRATHMVHNNLSGSLSINMKYKRRIVKILFFYLLTSIVCWSPLQFVIVYRHFRDEAQFSGWFPGLTFYSQLCATLSSAMNPIIFGFLSQPFRRVITKSWLVCFVNKLWATNSRNRSDLAKNNDNYAMDIRRGNNNNNNSNNNNINQHHINGNNLNCARSSQRITRDSDQPKLTIDYIEHEHRGGGGGTNAAAAATTGGSVSASRRVSIISSSHHSPRNVTHHHRNHHNRSNIDSFNDSQSTSNRNSLIIRADGQSSHKQRSAKIHRSHSSRDPQGGQEGRGIDDCNNNSNHNNKRVSFNGSSQLATINMNSSAQLEAGQENEAYIKDDGGDEEDVEAEMHQGPDNGAGPHQ